jgi:hypothetical protein
MHPSHRTVRALPAVGIAALLLAACTATTQPTTEAASSDVNPDLEQEEVAEPVKLDEGQHHLRPADGDTYQIDVGTFDTTFTVRGSVDMHVEVIDYPRWMTAAIVQPLERVDTDTDNVDMPAEDIQASKEDVSGVVVAGRRLGWGRTPLDFWDFGITEPESRDRAAYGFIRRLGVTPPPLDGDGQDVVSVSATLADVESGMLETGDGLPAIMLFSTRDGQFVGPVYQADVFTNGLADQINFALDIGHTDEGWVSQFVEHGTDADAELLEAVKHVTSQLFDELSIPYQRTDF